MLVYTNTPDMKSCNNFLIIKVSVLDQLFRSMSSRSVKIGFPVGPKSVLTFEETGHCISSLRYATLTTFSLNYKRSLGLSKHGFRYS